MKRILKILFLELELKKLSFFWWCFSWTILSIFFISVFDSVSGDQAATTEFLNTIPQELASSFNIGNNYLSQIESFISGQFLTLYLLIGGIFTAYTGINSIGGKIQSGQILEYVLRPFNRSKVFEGIYLANILFILLSNIFIADILYLSSYFLSSQNDISIQYFIYFFVGNFVMQFFFLNFGYLIGILFDSTKRVGIGIGFVVATWFINNILSLVDYPSWLNLLTPFYYFDTEKLSDEFILNGNLLITLFIIGISLMIISFEKWRKIDI